MNGLPERIETQIEKIVTSEGLELVHVEARIDAANSRVQLWIMPTNEELIVARQSRDCIAQ